MNNIALTFKTTWGWEFVQFVTLTDGRQLAIQGQTGLGWGIAPSYTIDVKKKSDMAAILKQAVNRGYILKDNYNDRLELQECEKLVARS